MPWNTRTQPSSFFSSFSSCFLFDVHLISPTIDCESIGKGSGERNTRLMSHLIQPQPQPPLVRLRVSCRTAVVIRSVMFRIIVTPPEGDANANAPPIPATAGQIVTAGTGNVIVSPPNAPSSSPSSSAAASAAAAGIAELRSLGVSPRMIALAAAADAKRAAQEREEREGRILSSSTLATMTSPSQTSTPPPPPPPPPSTLDAFERMRLECSFDDLSSDCCSSGRVSRLDEPMSASGDEGYESSVSANDERMVMSTSPPPPLLSSSSSHRIPSRLFRHTHTDRDGFLLPPVSNPDLGPSMERADSFWIQEGEGETLEEWHERQQQQQQHATTTTVVNDEDPSQHHKQSNNNNNTGNSLPTPLDLATSKTKSIYAHAMTPYNAGHRSSSSSSSSSASTICGDLLDSDDWSTVLDATVIVAHSELARPSANGGGYPSSDAPLTILSPTPIHRSIPRTAAPMMINASNNTNTEEINSLKRKDHPIGVQNTDDNRYKHMRLLSSSTIGMDVTPYSSTSSTPIDSPPQSHSSIPITRPTVMSLVPPSSIVHIGMRNAEYDQLNHDTPMEDR